MIHEGAVDILDIILVLSALWRGGGIRLKLIGAGGPSLLRRAVHLCVVVAVVVA